jgi:AcrR family transcriptional regulator
MQPDSKHKSSPPSGPQGPQDGVTHRTQGDGKTAHIRHCAYSCFAKYGYFGTTVDHICVEAGISKGAFYWHYPSKQAALLDVLNTWADEVECEVDAQFQMALASNDAYTSLAEAFKREARRGRAIMPVWMEFLAQSVRDEDMRAAIAHFHRRIRAVIVKLLTPVLESTLCEADIQALAGTILATFIGMVCQDLPDPDLADFDGHVQRFLSMVALFVRTQRQP